MVSLFHVFQVATDYGYAAFIEFFVDMGDQAVTHVIAVIVFKAGAIHVGWKVFKHVRRKKVGSKIVDPSVE
jgi:hypothetical protein